MIELSTIPIEHSEGKTTWLRDFDRFGLLEALVPSSKRGSPVTAFEVRWEFVAIEQ